MLAEEGGQRVAVVGPVELGVAQAVDHDEAGGGAGQATQSVREELGAYW